MAVSWARTIGNIRTPMPITKAELSSISATPVTNNAVEPLRSLGADDGRRHEAAYAICQEARKEKDPNESGGPTHAGVRANDWRGGRVVGDGCRVQAQNGHGQSSNPQMRRLASEVDVDRELPATR